jgi:hypothetical protein
MDAASPTGGLAYLAKDNVLIFSTAKDLGGEMITCAYNTPP